MKRILTLALIVVFAFGGGMFVDMILTENDTAMLIPAILFFLSSFVLLFLLCKEIFIGRNEYIFTDETIEVTRKGKAVAKIHKEQINKLILINDAFTKEREAISFLYCKKRFFITLTPCNKQKAEAFVSSIPYETKSNWQYYLLVFLSH